MSRLPGALIALVLVAAACSSDPRSNGGATGAAPASRTQGAPKAAASVPSPIANPNATVNVPPPPVAARTPYCADIFRPVQPPREEGRSWIYAAIDTTRDFGPKCPNIRAGSECWIPFTGGWQLAETPAGSIVFQVFENDATTAQRSPEVGPVPSGGRFSETTRMLYVPSRSARSATFRALLRDAAGRVVAQSIPQTIPVPNCQG